MQVEPDGWAAANRNAGGPARYILLTECLQNDFFLNPDCRLSLPDDVARRLLFAKSDLDARIDLRKELPADVISRGPLGAFLQAVVGARLRGKELGGPLHLINIRDWHVPGESYDLERRRYGSHCESGTWGANYVRGYERYLEPGQQRDGAEGRYHRTDHVHVHHIHSDSVFDFRPRVHEHGDKGLKYSPSRLENLLDILLLGSEAEVDQLESIADAPDQLPDLARRVGGEHLVGSATDQGDRPQVYVAVIGVYTDLKVLTLLAGIRTRYDLENLAVSDTLTASMSLERHLAGLDFASKLLGVEVIHGVNDLARFVGAPPPFERDSDVVSAEDFSKYQTFFQDKQSVLAYQDEKLHDYLRLTERRSIDVYERIKLTNTLLIAVGTGFLALTLVAAILNLVDPARFSWKITLVTGGLGLAQLVTAFYSKPMHDLQRNLTNLASFKMLLESHSLKTALARFHLTTPQVLREIGVDKEAQALSQVTVLDQEIKVIQAFDTADFADLARLSLPIDGIDLVTGAPGGSAAAAPGPQDGATQ